MKRYEVLETPSGRPTLICRDGSRVVKIHSSYDPVNESERAVAGFSPGRAGTVVVHGFGLGYHVASLKKRFPDLTVIAVERDPDVIDAARSVCPGHLEGVSLILSANGIPDVFEAIDMTGFRGIAHYRHRPSYLLDPSFYDAITDDIARYVASKMSDLLTRLEFEERWVANIIINLVHLFRAGRVRSLFGTFQGRPGAIVSAGPSLRYNVRHLAELRERAVIIAVDTALPVLRKCGVNPHIVMTLDAQKHSVRHFFGWSGRAVLCADMVSCPPVLRDWRGRAVVSTTAKYYRAADGTTVREATPLIEWVEEHAGAIGDVQSGGSVATSVFDLLLNMGCSPIILVGQDLAYTGREIHCSGTYHNDEWLPTVTRLGGLDAINQNIIRRRKTKWIPAYGGTGTVISDFVFDLYRGWFEDSVRKVPVPVVNATEGGVRIEGTREMPLAALVRELPRLNPSPEQVIERVLADEPMKNPERLIAALRGAMAELRRIAEDADRASDNGEAAIRFEAMAVDGAAGHFLQPFLRRSRLYLSRYQATPEEAAMRTLADIRAAVRRLLPALEKALFRLEGDLA